MFIAVGLLSFLLIVPPQFNSEYWEKLESVYEKEEIGLRPVIGQPVYVFEVDTWCVLFLLRGENEGNRIKITKIEGHEATISIPKDQQERVHDIRGACYVPHVRPPENIEKAFIVKFTDRDTEPEKISYYVKR